MKIDIVVSSDSLGLTFCEFTVVEAALALNNDTNGNLQAFFLAFTGLIHSLTNEWA